MECEVRFYYPSDMYDDLVDKLSNISDLQKSYRTYEKTMQFNHCDARYNFYSKEIDGRFRFRISSNDERNEAKLSWKRRLPTTTNSLVNKEEEVEVHILYDEVDNFLYLVENVMHFTLVESYERYRTVFINDDIEISVDEYPFGVALEIENKSKDKNPEDVILYYTNLLELDINRAYRLSWDDKYAELCKKEGKKIYKNVSFDKDMPHIK
ncbi:MAG: hypothetical protein SPF04_01525 [Bacilli bacterium]|nr:hypothetical protein [Bacilli bacterium]